MASPAGWDNEVVYYVMVDRFANGDMSNDMKNVPSYQTEQLTSGEPYSVGKWRHGGDLEGLRTRLGYLENLGVTTIWVSPILLNNDGYPYGYYMSDMAIVDPGFGSRELFRQVVKEAHDRGMKVVLDVLTNMGKSDGIAYVVPPSIDETTACVEGAEDMYWNTSYTPNETYLNQSTLTWGLEMPPYLMSQEFFQRCGAQQNYRPQGKLFSTLPKVYNDSGATGFDAGLLWPEAFAAPAPLPDFATMNRNWQELYTNMMMYWIAFADIDGLRLDAVKYVSADYVAYISTHVRKFAHDLGKSNFFVTGEMLSPGDVPFAYTYLGEGPEPMKAACSENPGCAALSGDCCPTAAGLRLKCCFDVSTRSGLIPRRVSDMYEQLNPLTADLESPGPAMPTFYPTDDHSYMREIANGEANASAWWLDQSWNRSMYNCKDLLTKQKAKATWTWQMVDSQDLTRLIQKEGQGDDIWRVLPALTWMFSWYGSPAVYYGMEQGLNGQCGSIVKGVPDAPLESIQALCQKGEDDDLKRQDLFTGGPWLLRSAIPEVNKFAMISDGMMSAGAPYWCEEPLLNRNPKQNQAYRDARALSRIRRSCTLLGTVAAMQAQDADPQVMAYWKFRDSATSPGPSCALVILDYNGPNPTNDYEIHAPSSSSKYTVWSPTFGVNLTVGQRFIDVLHPDRTATVAAGADGSMVLQLDAAAAPRSSGIFIPEEDAVDDDTGSDWKVCKAGKADLRPLPNYEECSSNPSGLPYMGGFMWLSSLVALGFVGFVLFIFVKNRKNCGIFLMKVKEPDPVETLPYPSPEVQGIENPRHVFVAAIEHTIPDRKVKVSAGGLGKVLDQMLREHPPGRLSLVHPKFAGVNYGELTPFAPLEVTVDMQKQTIQVYTCESTAGDIHRVWYLLEHKWFETQVGLDAPYPYPQTKLSVLRFFSLWNQAAAQLMTMLKPDVYHCMDYHAAMVPLYVPPVEQVATIIVLHNADYDGAIETEFINDVFWQGSPALRRLSLIFNLDTEAIRKYLTFEGRFNMLWGGIACIEENQGGHGICTVSGKYAAELKRERTMFKGLPAVLPLDNAIDSAADDGPKSIQELKEQRQKAKKALQEFCGLTVDPNAKILIFIGRWVKQKGVDHIALLASNMLDSYPEVQFVLAGPPGDPYGSYAQELLKPLAEQYAGRLFVVTKFFIIPKFEKMGAHFCLMPSCSEPFGYVDVEFGLLGVPSLGCAIGGLGKIPGVYFRQQNSDSQDMLLAGYAACVQYALRMDEREYWEMAFASIPAQFPFSVWRENLQVIYRHALLNFDREALASRDDQLTLDDETGYNVLMEHPASRHGYGKLASRKGAKNPGLAGVKVQHQLQRMQVNEATEFLMQPVSEQRVKELMSFWMATEGRETDAETLQSHISLGNQRMSERSFATRALMRPCRGFQQLLAGSCLRIHFFIALGYVISPILDARLKYLTQNAKALAADYNADVMSVFWINIGAAVGSFVWLGLSRQVPANLLMAVSLFMNQLVFSLANVLVSSNSVIWIFVFDFLSGMLTTSRWLFLIWNYNEDFHGGFQVGTRRVALIESCRSALAGVVQATSNTSQPGVAPILFSTIILTLIILIMLAPACYSLYVLPATNFMKELKDHKVYLFLILSMCLNGLGSFAWNNSANWLQLNGWDPTEINIISLIQSVVLIITLFVLFMSLHRMSIWGPWPMRDFTCLIPPGSFLYAVAFWELGNLHYRSYTFIVVLTVAWIMDVARFAAFWTSILTTLANKWYAIIGCFIGFAFIKVCEAVSPVVVHLVAIIWGVSPTWSQLVQDSPETHLPDLQKATMLSVWPLAILAYVAQVMAWKYFCQEVLTYKGHGHLMPDGTAGWASGSTTFMPATAIRAGATSDNGIMPEPMSDEDSEGSYDSDKSEED